MTTKRRILLELLVGIAVLAVLMFLRYDLLHPEFEPFSKLHEKLRKAVFERPQREPPQGVWRTSHPEKAPAVFTIPDRDMFFASFEGTHSLLLELRTNGTYQAIVREHVGAILWDKGKWSTTEKGDIALYSEVRYHDLRSDEHWYVMIHDDVLVDLPALKRDIVAFLEGSTDTTFSFADVQKIREYPSRYDANFTYSAFTGNESEPVSRQSLEKFTAEIDRYLSWDEKNVFHMRPIAYKSYAFLIDLDSQFFSPEEQIEQLRDQVDDLTGDQVPSYVYVALTEEMYDYETGRTEPFKFVKP